MNLLGWWRSRGNAARFDFYVRATFYLSYLVLPPLLIIGVVPEISTAALVAIGTAVLIHTALGVRLVHFGIEHHLGRTPYPRRLLVIFLVVTCAVLVAGQFAFPDPAPGKPDSPADGISLIFLVLTITSLSAVLRPRTVVLGSLAGGAFLLLTAPASNAMFGVFMLLLVAFAFRTTLWMLGLIPVARGVAHLFNGIFLAPKPEKQPDRKKSDKDRKSAKSTTKRESDFSTDEISELLNKTDEKPGGAKRNKKEKALGATKTTGGEKLSQTEMDALRGIVEKNWTVMPGQVSSNDIKIVVRFELDQNGEVVGDPEVTSSGGDGSSLRALEGGARRAVMKSAPFDQLPKDKYDTWKVVELSFYPSEMM